MRHEELTEQEKELLNLYHTMTRTEKAKILRLGSFMKRYPEEADRLFNRIGFAENAEKITVEQADKIDSYLERNGEPLQKWLEILDGILNGTETAELETLVSDKGTATA